ncbi:MAG: hypothetical protein IKC26_03535 [Clostridia bacterium]|nr:hypothetical protein [Clostridia bacterium]
MKKGIFKGNIKREYVSYIWFSIILVAVIGISMGSMVVFAALQQERPVDRYAMLVLGALGYLYGVIFPAVVIFAIRKYPKYPKLRRMCLNSDCYFVESDSKEFHGHWRGRAAFDMVVQAAEQNKESEERKYPKKYKVYVALTVIGIALMFIYLACACIVMENIDALPKAFQNEGAVLATLIIAEVLNMILTFVFAFRVRRIRQAVMEGDRK